MNTSDFLTMVLPEVGLRCIALASPSWPGFRQSFHDTNAGAADTAMRADTSDRTTVYFGCASYKSPKTELVPQPRAASNVQAVRSFWMDMDCGEGKPYANRKQAIAALWGFCDEAAIPKPALVGSGRGVHAYWPMLADMEPAEWLVTAGMLKAAARELDLHPDPSRTSDIASVLRPVGTHHKKGEPLPVTLIRGCDPTDHDAFRAALAVLVPEPEVELDILGATPAHILAQGANEDLTGGVGYAPAFADRIADKCGVLDLMRNPPEQLDQGTWYHSLQLLNRCEDGKVKAHEWSALDPRYKADQTDGVMARAGAHGPTTCAKMGEYHPAICKVCPHAGKIKSPISLGMDTVTPTPVLVSQRGSIFGSDETLEERQAAITMPHGYGWGKVGGCPRNQMYRTTKNDEGEDVQVAFSDTLFYPVQRLASDTGAGMEIEMVVRGDETRRFTVNASTVGEGGSALASILAANEIMALPRMKPDLDIYLSAWITKLKEEAEAVRARDHFGWHDNDFLIGSTMITPTGTTPAIVSGNAAGKAGAFKPQGSLDVWVDLIDKAYNYPGQEAFQFMVLCAFAAPLLNLLKQYGGVTVYAHSEGSGVGKTTAQRAGLSAFGNWKDLQLADGKTTANALWALIGTYSSLPVLFDELTNQSNAVASDVVLSVSSGRQKERLRSDGRLNTNNANWSTIVMASGNNLLSEKLSLHRGNAEAEISRLFEFTVPLSTRLSPSEAAQIFPKFLDNYGSAGVTYLTHIVQHREEVEKTLQTMHNLVNTEGRITQPERYWAALLACVLTALYFCRKLDIVRFPGAPLRDWMFGELNNNRAQRQQSVNGPLDLFGTMMSDLWAGVLVTVGEGDLRVRDGAAAVLVDPRGPMTGRCVLPTSNPKANERPMVALNASAVRTWCNKNGSSAKEMFDAVVAAGYADPMVQRYQLGRGCLKYSAISTAVKCWFIDPRKAGIDVGVGPMSAIIKDVAEGRN